MYEEFKTVASEILKARAAEDIFGLIGVSDMDTRLKAIKHLYRQLAKKVHEDLYPDPDQKELAKTAFQRLNDLHGQAEQKVRNGTYGDRSAADIIIKGKHEYTRFAEFASGDVADLHDAFYQVRGRRTDILLKLVRDPADNELLETERDVLTDLRKQLMDRSKGPSAWAQAIPDLIDSFRVDEGSYQKRRMNVLEKFDGFLSAEQILGFIPNGVDGRTIAWMWKRLVLMVDWTYRLGYIHGAVLPPHVMYYPDNDGKPGLDPRKHSIRLVDWCYALKHKSGKRLKAWVPKYEQFYAPEILHKEPLSAATDLYMGAKVMVYLAGGDVASNRIPSQIPSEIAADILKCLEYQPKDRPSDPQRYMDDFSRTLKRVYGPPKYHEFIVNR